MKRKIIFFTLFLSIFLLPLNLVNAAQPHIMVIAKVEQSDALVDYLASDFQITVVNETDLTMNPAMFSADALTSYDGFILGELIAGEGVTGARVMDSAIQRSIQERVEDGAGFVHIGGWTSYQGGNNDWGGFWHGTPIDEILPVSISSDFDTNDNGCDLPRLLDAKHSIVKGLDWRALQRVGGYNWVSPSDGANVVVIDFKSKAPLIVTGSYGNGKTVAFTAGLAGGWDEDFRKWSDFPQLWRQITSFVTS